MHIHKHRVLKLKYKMNEIHALGFKKQICDHGVQKYI